MIERDIAISLKIDPAQEDGPAAEIYLQPNDTWAASVPISEKSAQGEITLDDLKEIYLAIQYLKNSAKNGPMALNARVEVDVMTSTAAWQPNILSLLQLLNDGENTNVAQH
jgi:hypothetical protein